MCLSGRKYCHSYGFKVEITIEDSGRNMQQKTDFKKCL